MSAPRYVGATLAAHYRNGGAFDSGTTVSFGLATNVPSCFSDPARDPPTSGFVPFAAAQKAAARSALASGAEVDGTIVRGGGSLGLKPAGRDLITTEQFVA